AAMARVAEATHVERFAIVVTQQAIAFLRGMPDERRKSFVGHLHAVVARGSLPHATLQALAVDEQAVHVADDGGGAMSYHGVDSLVTLRRRQPDGLRPARRSRIAGLWSTFRSCVSPAASQSTGSSMSAT